MTYDPRDDEDEFEEDDYHQYIWGYDDDDYDSWDDEPEDEGLIDES